MKNITLALDEKIINKTRDIAARNGTSLNGLIRSFLERLCGEGNQSTDSIEDDWLEDIFSFSDKIVKPTKIAWTRDEVHRF